MVGFVFGILGTSHRFGPEAPATVKLKHHSHMLAVLPSGVTRAVGYALKLAQRESRPRTRAAADDVDVRPAREPQRAAHIAKLGTVCCTYARDYYGEMRDELNGRSTQRPVPGGLVHRQQPGRHAACRSAWTAGA